jgi:hypothetical protein
MNTLKMKVLLILCNRHLFRAIGKALLVWLSANVAGCGILYGLKFFFFQSPADFITGMMLSLIFSSPAIIIAAWVLYALPLFSNAIKRTALSLLAILLTSAFIIWIVATVFQLEYIYVTRVLYPFTLSAIACFFLIARKQIISTTLY